MTITEKGACEPRLCTVRARVSEQEKKAVQERMEEIGYKKESEYIRHCINLEMKGDK